MNVTRLGRERLQLKLPGGGGGCNLSCDVDRVTIWTAAHRSPPDSKGPRRFRLVEDCDFTTSVGHRSAEGKTRPEMRYRGQGPDSLVTELGIFDFDGSGHARLAGLYPDVDVPEVRENTGFAFPVREDLGLAPLPTPEMVEFIRALDPLLIHERELWRGVAARVYSNSYRAPRPPRTRRRAGSWAPSRSLVRIPRRIRRSQPQRPPRRAGPHRFHAPTQRA
jgi:glutaconate CoA-transferase subunit B